MEIVSPKSRLIRKIGYDDGGECRQSVAHGVLHVWLKSGRYARHIGIPRDEFERFTAAASPGRYYMYHLAGLQNHAPMGVRWARWPLVLLLGTLRPFRHFR